MSQTPVRCLDLRTAGFDMCTEVIRCHLQPFHACATRATTNVVVFKRV